ncbi:MAG: MBL fold metallo-hydrolase [Deltaproteobacteria bacterium]|nr:MBL fold metallo-hydrolase [Deltaproteobacteria bacterium]
MQQHTVQTPYVVGEVHFYSAELESGIVLFDTGPPTPEGIAHLQSSVDLARLKYLFITHCHVDHYGLANFILQNSTAEIFIPRRDAIKFQRHAERMVRMSEILNGYGFGEDFTTHFRESVERHKIFPAQPERFQIVEEYTGLDELGISYIPCPGHSQSDLVYLVGEYAVTGDILLRNIFQAPLLDVDFETFKGRFRNYAAYCASIINLARLRGRQIMPGHRQYVQSLDEALLFYVRTLLERSAQLLPLKSLAVNEIINRLFQGRQSDPFYVYLKISEVVFMLDFIENPALLKASLELIGLFDEVSELYSVFA